MAAVEVQTPEVPESVPTPPPVVEAQEEIPMPGTLEDWLTQLGIPTSDWGAVKDILHGESDICHTRWEGYHGICQASFTLPYEGAETDPYKGYGLCQSTPAIKMASAGEDWRTNPITQLRWCNDYAQRRYGGWQNAYSVWQRQRWW